MGITAFPFLQVPGAGEQRPAQRGAPPLPHPRPAGPHRGVPLQPGRRPVAQGVRGRQRLSHHPARRLQQVRRWRDPGGVFDEAGKLQEGNAPGLQRPTGCCTFCRWFQANKLLCFLSAGSMRGWWRPPTWTYLRTPPSGSARETPPTASLRLAAAAAAAAAC